MPTAGGYLLVTPFGIDGGDTVYVDRGFVGSAADVPDAPGGAVALTARFRGIPGAAESVPDGAAYLDRIESAPDEPDVTARPLPALDEGPHLSYAFQWFIFSGCVVVGWVLAVRRSARPRSTPADGSPATKQEARSDRPPPAPAGRAVAGRGVTPAER